MICLPLLLVVLGITGQYNIFMEIATVDMYGIKNRQHSTFPLSQTYDTRTFLYTEVITDVVKNNSVLFGKSPSQPYHSDFFTNSGGAIDGRRYSSEVHILNMLLYFGLFGVILFLSFLVHVAYIGLFQSNNFLSKMLALLILSRYMLSFIEEFTLYNLNWFFFWLIMGLVASKKFRNMTDAEIKYWLSPNIKGSEKLLSN
jgi:hypothetical protein